MKTDGLKQMLLSYLIPLSFCLRAVNPCLGRWGPTAVDKQMPTVHVAINLLVIG